MYTFKLINLETGLKFNRTFYNLDLAKKFANKLKYSKRIDTLSEVWESFEDYAYVHNITKF